MTIKRDILGTIVNIELTEQELTNAHIAYLEQEIKALKAGKKEELMPDEIKPTANDDYLDKLHECCDRLRKERSSRTRSRIIDVYQDSMMEALANGLTTRQISVAMGVCDKVVRERVNGLIRMRSIRHTA